MLLEDDRDGDGQRPLIWSKPRGHLRRGLHAAFRSGSAVISARTDVKPSIFSTTHLDAVGPDVNRLDKLTVKPRLLTSKELALKRPESTAPVSHQKRRA
jgi:hypothetical protein